MSRSSKGFADFFPTAPSVLQQKRSKPPLSRKRPRSPSGDESTLSQISPAHPISPLRGGEGRPSTNGACNGHLWTDQRSIIPDETETAHGDLLNGVGSASSTSTSSSLFSTKNNQQGTAVKNGSANLTPMTHVESSPPHSSLASPEWKNVRGRTTSSRDPSNLAAARAAMFEAQDSVTPGAALPVVRKQAHPGKGESRGIRVVYDPELDNTLTSKERKNRKVQEAPFGIYVGLSMDQVGTLKLTEWMIRTERVRQLIPGSESHIIRRAQLVTEKHVCDCRHTNSIRTLLTRTPSVQGRPKGLS